MRASGPRWRWTSQPAPAARADLAHATTTVSRLHRAGLRLLAGTDASSPGTAHGASLHDELHLLVHAGLPPAAALAAPPPRPPRAETGSEGEGEIFTPSSPVPRPDSAQATPPQARGAEAGALAEATITALRPGQQARIDELGRRRLERATAPLVASWTPADLARRIGAERLDRAENLAAVLCAVLRRYALEPAPRELRAAEQAARLAGAAQPPPQPCMHGDPGGCAACSFCRRGLADPGGERCERCVPSVPSPQVVTA